ncbi:hypothetical protein [Bacillus sp. SG-1]|uniref:hypothetical protein n=1 Tax=Bacillus sp. SG-1 TaxID=161544 RepID=UPI0001543CCA|nr:hypothetical protein [Bacillus sp. SG-1]EDL66765.1 hypothetical protein BSG1_05395 [Bacillus sp. SG-1]
MRELLKWFIFSFGLAVMLGVMIWGSTIEKPYSSGVDLGLGIYYFGAVMFGGLLIFISSRIDTSYKGNDHE